MSTAIVKAKAVIRSLEPIGMALRRMNGHSILAISGMAGPVVLVVCDFTAAFSTPGYNMIKDSISSLALTSLGWLQIIGFLAIGLLIEIYTAGLLFNIKRSTGFHLGIGLMVLFGFSMLLIGAFRTDPIGAERTVEGRIHGFTAMMAFWIFPLAILIIANSLKNDSKWQGFFKYTLVTGILAIALGITIKVIPGSMSWFGLLERVLVANMIFWVEATAIRMLILSLKRVRPAMAAIKPRPG
jgi:hypothetical protein